MTSVIAPYRSDVAVGKFYQGGKEVQVFPSDFLVRWLNQQLLDRLGGTDQATITELVNEIAEIVGSTLNPSPDARASETARELDDLRNAISSLRNDCDMLRSAIADRDAELASIRPSTDLRQRVEQLEDRLL